MKNNCRNCYYKNRSIPYWCTYEIDQPDKESCKHHELVCESCGYDIVKYKHEGKHYCTDCLLREYEIEECTTTSYFSNGEYLGDDNDFDEVIENLDGVEKIK